MWPDRRLLKLLGIEVPIVQAPMAGAMEWELAAAAAQAGLRPAVSAAGIETTDPWGTRLRVTRA